jgi:PAS domain S-box-containing protein
MPSPLEPPQPYSKIFEGSNDGSIWDNIPGVIYQMQLATDGTMHFSYMSSGCLNMFGISPAMVVADGNSLLKMMHPDDVQGFRAAVDKSARTLSAVPWQGRAVLANGEVKWLESSARPKSRKDGSVVWDGVVIDITDRKLTEIALERTNQELQQATRLKDEFLANMSHELRTPLNAILGLSEGLQEMIFGELNDRQLKSIATIERSGRRLLSVINDILDVSKLTAGQMELEISQISAAQLLGSCLSVINAQAQKKNIQVHQKLPSNDLRIHVDEARLRQVLLNLLTNAVKFTPERGHVALGLAQVGESICFTVTDTGCGIAEADLPKIFQPFVQIDGQLNRKYEGLGLGLALAYQIVQLHGGSIEVQSQVNRGSCFTVLLPVACLKQPVRVDGRPKKN